MKPSARDLLVLLMLIGMPLGSYFLVLRPANQEFAVQRAQISEKTQKLDNLRLAVGRIDDLEAEVVRLSEAVRFFEAKLPKHHEIYNVLAKISAIAESQMLETELFETQKLKTFGQYIELPIKIRLKGDFDSYYQFLIELERMPRITRVSKMQLRTDGDELAGDVKAELTLSIFFEQSAGV